MSRHDSCDEKSEKVLSDICIAQHLENFWMLIKLQRRNKFLALLPELSNTSGNCNFFLPEIKLGNKSYYSNFKNHTISITYVLQNNKCFHNSLL